jgi:hypothetical protein
LFVPSNFLQKASANVNLFYFIAKKNGFKRLKLLFSVYRCC